MNRFLGPHGYYYGIKPDRTLQEEKLLRQLRKRFPHLSLHPHPAYREPWLSPKHPPSSYAQVPYFPPGLQFPYVSLKGPTSQRARHVHYPFGVFQRRPFRFDPPLYNLRLTRRMRQGRFHNVFHQKHLHGKVQASLHKRVSSSQLARALGSRNDVNAKLRAHLMSDSSAEPKGQGRLISFPKDQPFRLDDQPAKLKRSELVEEYNSDHDEATAELSGSKHREKSLKSSPEANSGKGRSTHQTTNDKAKSARVGKASAPPLKGLLKKPISKHTKPNMSEPDGINSHNESEQDTTNSLNIRADRGALETIARRKKQERHLQKERRRAAQERQRTEQEYLKKVLIKSLKPQRRCDGLQLKRTKSQKRRAMYRKYREKQPLTPEEEVEISRRKQRHHVQSIGRIPTKTGKHPKSFPYGKMPPKFQKTPASADRFFWGSDGPELRNKENRDKPNVFRRHSEEVISGVRDDTDASAAKPPVHQDNPKKSSGKDAHSAMSKSALPATLKAKVSKNLSASVADRGSKLLASSAVSVVKSGSSSSLSGLTKKKPSRQQVLQKSSSTSVKSPTDASSKIDQQKPVEQKPNAHRHRKHKKKRCRRSETNDGLQQNSLSIKHPETFIEAREELMKLREKAWLMSLRREVKKREERRWRIAQDQELREAEVRKVTQPVAQKTNRKLGAAHNLSFNTLPTVVVSGVSKPSRASLPSALEGSPVVLEQNKIFPKAANRREAFRAYVAKRLLRLKAKLVYNHRFAHANKDPLLDRWGRPVRTEIPLFDNRNPYLVKVIKNLMRTKTGFRFKYETRAEEFLTNFPFVEYQTYRRLPVGRMTKHDRAKHYVQVKKMYRGQRLFKMMTPLRWYKSVKKNSLETPFDFQLYSDAVEKFGRLSKNQNDNERNLDEPGESYRHSGLYEVVCDHLKIPPLRKFQDQLAVVIAGESRTIQLANQNLTNAQVRPIAMCVMLSELVDHLDVSGNLLSPAGGRYVAGICGHTGNLSELNASNQPFDVSVAEVFFRCLRRPYCKIKKLWLSNCNFSSECARIMAAVIMENRSLVTFDLSKNQLGSVGNNDMFGSAIAENTVIKELNLSHNGFGEKASYLIFHGASANTALEYLNYSYNHVGDEGCKSVAKMLEVSDKIRSLELEHCVVTDVGAKRLATGIDRSMGCLEELNLRDNPVTGIGANLILKTVSTKENLRHVDLSLCPVNAAFVAAATKVATEQTGTSVDHTGDKPAQSALPKYEIDVDAIAAKKAKAEAAKKARKNK